MIGLTSGWNMIRGSCTALPKQEPAYERGRGCGSKTSNEAGARWQILAATETSGLLTNRWGGRTPRAGFSTKQTGRARPPRSPAPPQPDPGATRRYASGHNPSATLTQPHAPRPSERGIHLDY